MSIPTHVDEEQLWLNLGLKRVVFCTSAWTFSSVSTAYLIILFTPGMYKPMGCSCTGRTPNVYFFVHVCVSLWAREGSFVVTQGRKGQNGLCPKVRGDWWNECCCYTWRRQGREWMALDLPLRGLEGCWRLKGLFWYHSVRFHHRPGWALKSNLKWWVTGDWHVIALISDWLLVQIVSEWPWLAAAYSTLGFMDGHDFFCNSIPGSKCNRARSADCCLDGKEAYGLKARLSCERW